MKKDANQLGLTSVYLVLYNVIQMFGWSFILGKCVVAMLIDSNSVWRSVHLELGLFQTVMLMEVVHSAFGLVRSPVFLTFIQIMSRLFIVWALTWPVTQAQSSFGVPLYVIAWSLTEVVRYSYYASVTLKSVPAILQWARYSFFIVLYPLGVFGEILTILSAMPVVHEARILSLDLPNVGNMSFSFYHALILALVLYVPFFPLLYLHMLKQRKKVLGREKAE